MTAPESAPRRLPDPPLPPRAWLGLLGGGQLGRMFCMAAQSMGYRVCVLDPGGDSPAGTVADRHLRAEYLDPQALSDLAGVARATTTEFENVPARALAFLADHGVVSPGADAVRVAQDRIAEKRFVRDAGAQVAPHVAVLSPADIDAADAALLPGILKVARLGYDGKGQARVADRAEAQAAFAAFGGVPCVLEQRLALALEVSVIVARGFDGATACWPVAENAHRGGILARTVAPARVSDALAAQARSAALAIAQRLDYVGVLCVEFFVLQDGSLLVNELAPRPHNSGHHTIDACFTSQFEQQARVLAGLPLGDTRQHSPAVMLNLLGDCWLRGGTDGAEPVEPDWRVVLRHPRAKLHLYGKATPRIGRKMGHVTVLGDTLDDALAAADRIARDLGVST